MVGVGCVVKTSFHNSIPRSRVKRFEAPVRQSSRHGSELRARPSVINIVRRWWSSLTVVHYGDAASQKRLLCCSLRSITPQNEHNVWCIPASSASTFLWLNCLLPMLFVPYVFTHMITVKHVFTNHTHGYRQSIPAASLRTRWHFTLKQGARG